MTELSRKDKMLLIYMTVALTVLAVIYFMFVPAIEKRGTLEAEVEILAAKEIDTRQKIETINQYLTKIESGKKFIKEELNLIPDYTANEDLAIILAGFVVSHNMKTTSMSLNYINALEGEESSSEGSLEASYVLESFLDNILESGFLPIPTGEETVTAELTFEEYMAHANIRKVPFTIELMGTRANFLNLLDTLQRLANIDTSSTSDIPYSAESAFSISGVFYMSGEVIPTVDSSNEG